MSIITVSKEFLDKIDNRLASVNLSMSYNVRKAFKEITRSYFVRDQDIQNAFRDTPLPIPSKQTISAPHMYAMMMAKELLDPRPGLNILEIGAGSGYGAALLGKIVYPGKVISIERHNNLVEFARVNVKKVGLHNVKIIHGDGTKGIKGEVFDRIIITAAGPVLPTPLIKQLKYDGILVAPIEKNREQWLWKITLDTAGKPIYERSMRVVFVPLIGEHGYESK